MREKKQGVEVLSIKGNYNRCSLPKMVVEQYNRMLLPKDKVVEEMEEWEFEDRRETGEMRDRDAQLEGAAHKRSRRRDPNNTREEWRETGPSKRVSVFLYKVSSETSLIYHISFPLRFF